MATETAIAKKTALVAEKRTKTGTSESRRLRRDGLVPGNVYGHKQEPVSIVVSATDIEVATARMTASFREVGARIVLLLRTF